MLSISRFSEDKEGILKGLKKRKFDNFEIIDKIIDLDISRKKLQQDLDQILFESLPKTFEYCFHHFHRLIVQHPPHYSPSKPF